MQAGSYEINVFLILCTHTHGDRENGPGKWEKGEREREKERKDKCVTKGINKTKISHQAGKLLDWVDNQKMRVEKMSFSALLCMYILWNNEKEREAGRLVQAYHGLVYDYVMSPKKTYVWMCNLCCLLAASTLPLLQLRNESEFVRG